MVCCRLHCVPSALPAQKNSAAFICFSPFIFARTMTDQQIVVNSLLETTTATVEACTLADHVFFESQWQAWWDRSELILFSSVSGMSTPLDRHTSIEVFRVVASWCLLPLAVRSQLSCWLTMEQKEKIGWVCKQHGSTGPLSRSEYPIRNAVIGTAGRLRRQAPQAGSAANFVAELYKSQRYQCLYITLGPRQWQKPTYRYTYIYIYTRCQHIQKS